MFTFFTGALWSLIWHFGAIYGVMILALAYAVASQMFLAGFLRNTALFVALGAFIIGATAIMYTKLGENYVQAKWDAAEQAAIARGDKARTDAEKKVGDTPAGPDEFDRDK